MKSSIPKKYLTGARNYVSQNRRWVTIGRHLPVVLRPLVGSVSAVVVWYYVLYINGIGFEKDAENPLLFIILPLVSFVYVIFASIAINSVFDEYKIVAKAVVKRDLETFLLHRDEQIPILLYILIAIPSGLLVILSMLFHYENPIIGACAVFSVCFIIFTAWLVSTELDNFEKGIWFKESIPQEWLEIDVQAYFDNKVK